MRTVASGHRVGEKTGAGAHTAGAARERWAAEAAGREAGAIGVNADSADRSPEARAGSKLRAREARGATTEEVGAHSPRRIARPGAAERATARAVARSAAEGAKRMRELGVV